MKKRHEKAVPEHSSTKRRPVLEYSNSGVVVVGHVLRATGESCDEQNNPSPRMTPVVESTGETKRPKKDKE